MDRFDFDFLPIEQLCILSSGEGFPFFFFLYLVICKELTST